MICNPDNALIEYFQLLSDCINLAHKLDKNSGDKRLYKNTKDSLKQRILPCLLNLTNKFFEDLGNLTNDYYPNLFLSEYNCFIENGKFREAENFSRDWLRHLRDGKPCPQFKSFNEYDDYWAN